MSESQNGGPPAVLSPKQIDQVEALAAVCTKTQMAAYFGVTEKTFRAIEQRQSEVFTAYRRGKARAVAGYWVCFVPEGFRRRHQGDAVLLENSGWMARNSSYRAKYS